VKADASAKDRALAMLKKGKEVPQRSFNARGARPKLLEADFQQSSAESASPAQLFHQRSQPMNTLMLKKRFSGELEGTGVNDMGRGPGRQLNTAPGARRLPADRSVDSRLPLRPSGIPTGRNLPVDWRKMSRGEAAEDLLDGAAERTFRRDAVGVSR
jgi:hypothetical protein